jgi:hypothetical protein
LAQPLRATPPAHRRAQLTFLLWIITETETQHDREAQ